MLILDVQNTYMIYHGCEQLHCQKWFSNFHFSHLACKNRILSRRKLQYPPYKYHQHHIPSANVIFAVERLSHFELFKSNYDLQSSLHTSSSPIVPPSGPCGTLMNMMTQVNTVMMKKNISRIRSRTRATIRHSDL